MPEQAVKQHVQISAVHPHAPLTVKSGQPIRAVIDIETVRADSVQSPLRLESQAAQGNIQETHVQIELIPGLVEDLRAQIYLLQLPQLPVSGWINHKGRLPGYSAGRAGAAWSVEAAAPSWPSEASSGSPADAAGPGASMALIFSCSSRSSLYSA